MLVTNNFFGGAGGRAGLMFALEVKNRLQNKKYEPWLGECLRG